MSASANQLAAASRLFSSAVLRELATKGRSRLFAHLFKQTSLSHKSLAQVRDAFEAVFHVLQAKGSRDEYIYKAALTHKVLLGTHSLRTASLLTEFRVGMCKADVAILNGTSTVYEVKSERDSLTRLQAQIDTYKKVFAKVYVIAGEKHVASVIASTSADVGVLQLSRRYRIVTVRDAQENPHRICPLTVFDSLRTHEAKAILQGLGVSVPDVPNTMLRTELRNLFAHVNSGALHLEMVRTLKRTRSLVPLAELLDSLPASLQAAAISVPLRKNDHTRLVQAVATPLRDALKWT